MYRLSEDLLHLMFIPAIDHPPVCIICISMVRIGRPLIPTQQKSRPLLTVGHLRVLPRHNSGLLFPLWMTDAAIKHPAHI